ncbi:uncharacterized protein JCM15063_004328 [Sporobolomyces koalae]|uniref:uncharacterized protein n=1 Tax=Sporobolomyces koalae TaxID=500713 RepID=UPI0031756017
MSEPLRSRRAPPIDPTASPSIGSTGSYAPAPAPPHVTTDTSTSRFGFASTDKPTLTNRSSKPERAIPESKRIRTKWDKLGGGLNLQPGETRVITGLVMLGAVVRYWKIGRPSSVVFDEVHFGGFANKYIQSRFFMDVHPPLAKLLITLVAWLFGFEGGQFDFKDIGREYGPEHVPYIAMRLLPATLGLALVPLTYLTLRALQLKPATALLGSIFVLFENGLITQSRFILLDSPLIFFTALSVFFWIGFSNENDLTRDKKGTIGPFSRRWWTWLTLTGLALGAVVSCKWVGLFTIATVGVFTIVQLWLLLGDLRVPIPLLVRHFVARAICLIVVPALFYLSMFAIHFAILSNSGEGDGFMSSEFQHTLQGHGMDDTFADVMVGSKITLRHLHTQGGYLHSHASVYPTGSKQQQVTLYPHRDDNNIWLLLNSTKNPDVPDPEHHAPATPVLDRAIIVLHHVSTQKKLHSHDIRAPVTEVDYQNEVSAYGFDGFEGDANDHFQIEIDQSESHGSLAKKQVQTLRSRFRLRHVLTGCYLFSHKVKLPDWGFEQQEVTCNKNPSKENAIWFIETNTHPMLPDNARKVNYRRPGFLAKFLELQAVMWRTNQGLTDRHAYDSRPHSWPLLLRGINFWVKDHRQIYLIGNPFVWALSTFAVLAYAGVRALLILRAQRGYKDFAHSQVVFYDRVCTFLALGWFLHYFPFFIMQRQLFLHHYFPALYFALLLTAVAFDLLTSMLRPRVRLQLAVVLILGAVGAWYYLSPLTYAGVWTRGQCEQAKRWGKNWDFSCADFHIKKSDYYPTLDKPHTTTTTTTNGVNNANEPPPVQASTSLAQAGVQPGRPAFEVEEKAPVSSLIPEDPSRLRVDLDDDDDLSNLEELSNQDHDAREAESAHTTEIARDGEQFEKERERELDPGLGVAVPVAAEGTSTLPIPPIEKKKDQDTRQEDEESQVKHVREQGHHDEEEQKTGRQEEEEEEAEIDLGEPIEEEGWEEDH